MRSLSCVNVVHLICGIRTMKMNSNRSIYMVKRIKTKNNNDNENVCYYYCCYHFTPFSFEVQCVFGGALRQIPHSKAEFIFYINCAERNTHTLTHAPLNTTARERYIYIAVDEKTFQPWTKIYGLQTMPHMENNTQNLLDVIAQASRSLRL